MDYKDTLALPTTNFPMRGNLPQNEPKTYQLWKSSRIYPTMEQNRKNAGLSFFSTCCSIGNPWQSQPGV